MTFSFIDVNVPTLERVTLENGSRYYVVDGGKKYPSVTTVLSEHTREIIETWKAKVGEETAKQIGDLAARRGTRVHSLIEKYLRGSAMSLTDPVTIDFFSRLTPALNRISNIRLLETPLYSHHLRLAGTVDCIADYDDRLSAIDFKSSLRKKEKENIEHYFMQCAAYAIMYEELTGTPVDKLVVIIANDDEETQVFVEKRDNFVEKLLHYRNKYEKMLDISSVR
jgi:ATP-dependent exoDNAse (exonuclease V) beta subunit